MRRAKLYYLRGLAGKARIQSAAKHNASIAMSQPDLLRFEEEAWRSGFLHLAGVDEAGRGPLAGPVVAAAISSQLITFVHML